MDEAVCRKRELFRIWKQSRNEEDRKKYTEAKKDAKRVVYVAMDLKALEAVVLRRVICIGMVVSWLELPNKGLGRRKMLGLFDLQIKLGR